MADELELIITPPPEVVVETNATDPPVIQLNAEASPAVVTAYAVGPQGPVTPSLGAIPDVNTTAKIDKSLLYFDAASAQFRADATTTTTTLTDGGNF